MGAERGQFQECVCLQAIWQKGESQNGGNKNTKPARFPEKQTFLTPDLAIFWPCSIEVFRILLI